MNAVALIGNCTRDPELRATAGGTSVCQLRIAVNERVKAADGTWGDRANYFDVSLFGGRADTAAQWLHKGSKVGVQGRLRWEEWEKDGVKRQAVKVVADNVDFLTPKQQDAGGGAPADIDGDVPF